MLRLAPIVALRLMRFRQARVGLAPAQREDLVGRQLWQRIRQPYLRLPQAGRRPRVACVVCAYCFQIVLQSLLVLVFIVF